MQVTFTSIGTVEGGREKATKDHWAENRSTLHLDPDRFTPASLEGLTDQSHIMVVFYFNVDENEPVEMGSRHPRERQDWPSVGIFAQRGRMRPNRVGVSICRLLGVTGTDIEVEGLDAVHGTPILDIKPVWSGYGPRGDFKEPDWSKEIMKNYW